MNSGHQIRRESMDSLERFSIISGNHKINCQSLNRALPSVRFDDSTGNQDRISFPAIIPTPITSRDTALNVGQATVSQKMTPSSLLPPHNQSTLPQQRSSNFDHHIAATTFINQLPNAKNVKKDTKGLTNADFDQHSYNSGNGLSGGKIPSYGILNSQRQNSVGISSSMTLPGDNTARAIASTCNRFPSGFLPEDGTGVDVASATTCAKAVVDSWMAVEQKPALPSSTMTGLDDPTMFFGLPPLPPPSTSGTHFNSIGYSALQSAPSGAKKRVKSASTYSSDTYSQDVLSIVRLSPTTLIHGDDSDSHHQHQQLSHQREYGRLFATGSGFRPGSGSICHMSAREIRSPGSTSSSIDGGPRTANGVGSRSRINAVNFSSVGSVEGRRYQQRAAGVALTSTYDEDDDGQISIIESMSELERGSRYLDDDDQQSIAADAFSMNHMVVRSNYAALCTGGRVMVNEMPYDANKSKVLMFPDESDFSSSVSNQFGKGNKAFPSPQRPPPPYSDACRSVTVEAQCKPRDGDLFPKTVDQVSLFGQMTSDFGSTSLNEEIQSTSSPGNFQCVCLWESCGQQFQEQDDLVQHIEREHIDHRSAMTGSAAILSNGIAASPVGAVSDEFMCRWAGCKRQTRPFNARYKLVIHMRVHSGEKPHRCNAEGCDKSFSRLENLKIHLRSHTGERPYVCSYSGCMKAFSNSSDRAKHQRTHIDTKPYACPVPNCDKKYTDPSSLRKHQKIHSGLQHLNKKVKKEVTEEFNSSTPTASGSHSELNSLSKLLSVHSVVSNNSKDSASSGQQLQQQQQPEMLFGRAAHLASSSTAQPLEGPAVQSASDKQRSLNANIGHTEHRQIVGGGFNSQSSGSLLTASMRGPNGSTQSVPSGGNGLPPLLGPAIQVRKIHQNGPPPPPYPASAATETVDSQMWANNSALRNHDNEFPLFDRPPTAVQPALTQPTTEYQQHVSSGTPTSNGQENYLFDLPYGSSSYRYIEQLYANDSTTTFASSSSSIPELPPIQRSSNYVSPPSYFQHVHQHVDYMPCNIQQRMAYGTIGGGNSMGPYHSAAANNAMYHQMMPDSLDQTLTGLPGDAVQLSDLTGLNDFTASTVQEFDYLAVHNC